ncbi:hypothetical protein AGDE_17046 [Angomonas deanei]|nr:hypothetical protein AGDE_17046 [Angomonas deanei]|eukprot:EPY15617.1 hypothetical protein AGDE_17046 [Angomonas deanei]
MIGVVIRRGIRGRCRRFLRRISYRIGFFLFIGIRWYIVFIIMMTIGVTTLEEIFITLRQWLRERGMTLTIDVAFTVGFRYIVCNMMLISVRGDPTTALDIILLIVDDIHFLCIP